MKLKLSKKAEGFTIIEVLIVLAIAGLILLIVFLAVPALQRNSRNTGRKNDVASILGAMSEFTNNNNGAFPAACAAGATGCNDPAATNSWLKNAKVGTLDKDKVSFVSPAAAAAGGAAGDVDSVVLTNYSKCSSATASTATNATKRSLVAMYKVETGGGTLDQCVESGS